MNANRPNNAALVGGTLLIGFGLLTLASQIFRDVHFWSYLWPLAVVVCGALFFAGMFLGGRQVSGLAIPGSIITGIGLLLLYQSLSSNWESWAYSWALIVIFVGLGIFIMGLYTSDEARKQAGVKVMKIGAVLFVVFGAFFEMIFSMDRTLGFRGLLFPGLLILLGGYLIVSRLGVLGGREKPSKDPNVPSEPPSSVS